MAANFSISQDLAEVSIITLTDTSTGLSSITDRLVYITQYDGSALVPTGTTTSYIEWVAADSTIDIDVLDKDYCLLIRVVWLSGSTSAATKTTPASFTGYSRNFLISLSRANAANPRLVNNANFYSNKVKLRNLCSDADELVTYMNDITGGQLCLEQARELYSNPKLFY
jgi:hypothetical protein